MRLLLAEDDLALVENLLPMLNRAGYVVDYAVNGREASFLGDETEYDMVILDLGLPQKNGLEVLRHWREKGRRMPILILTARDAWHDKVTGLKSGADDYLTKPFHAEELLARIQALIRRSHGRQDATIHTQDLELDEERQCVIRQDGSRIELTGTEFRLLRYFMLNPERPLSKTRLTEHIYDQEFDLDSNLIEVYVRRLRDKIGRQHIETRRGQGYVFKP